MGSARPFLLAVLGTTLVLGGCYGSTEPATDIGFDHVTFNGRGTTNNGPASVYFEFWETAQPDHVHVNVAKDVPAGVTGPISAPNFPFPIGLRVDTDYTFRMCGKDQGAANAACAQTRTFRTKRPNGDFVSGGVLAQVGGSGHDGGVNAQSDASGANPTGTLRLPDSGGNALDAHVTCLAVHGNDAAVGGVGTRADGTPASGLLEIRDDPTSADADKLAWTITPNGSAPNCASATFANLGTALITIFSVYDAPGSTPTIR